MKYEHRLAWKEIRKHMSEDDILREIRARYPTNSLLSKKENRQQVRLQMELYSKTIDWDEVLQECRRISGQKPFLRRI